MKYSSLSKHRPLPLLLRAIALWLACAEAVLPVSNQLLAANARTAPAARTASDSSPSETGPADRPAVAAFPPQAPHGLQPYFSPTPSDAEFFVSPILGAPLVPMPGPKQAGEDRELAGVLTGFYRERNLQGTADLEGFLTKYPNSRWAAALLERLGNIYHKTGRFTAAADAWRKGWDLSKNETAVDCRAIADAAVASLAKFYVFLGQRPEVERVFAEITGRKMESRAAEDIAFCRSAHWQMVNEPERAFRCGPIAIASLWRADKSEHIPDAIEAEPSTKKGTSLAQMVRLARRVGLDYQIARRRPGAAVLSPALVHWKLGHFSALGRERNGKFLAEDTMFSRNIWLTAETLDAEASGYFIVKAGALPRGWTSVSEGEGENIWGQMSPVYPEPNATSKYDHKAKDCDKQLRLMGMPDYNIHSLLASLNVFDTPVGYQPHRGPSMYFRVDYNHRENSHQGTLDYSNLGPRWNYDWLAYVQEDDDDGATSVDLHPPGGGVLRMEFDLIANKFKRHKQSHSQLVRTNGGYEEQFPNGAKAIYNLTNTAAVDNKIFITKFIDAASNVVTFRYAGTRLSEVVDATGGTNKVEYGTTNLTDYLITKVTDRYGRYATFQYDAGGHLTNIVDVIGMGSSFIYDGDFMTSMTTPYGTTRFYQYQLETLQENSRWIEVVDPYGEKERVEFRHQAPGVASFADQSQLPAGMNVYTNKMEFRNTFFWDKKAMRDYPVDYSKARVFQWLHDEALIQKTQGILQDEKQPLEYRIWYLYDGQPTNYSTGNTDRPNKIGRRLDDGTTQTNSFQYDAFHNLTNYVDSVGRSTRFIYAANGADLSEVRQVRGSVFDLVAKFTYNSQHLPLTYVDAAGQTNRFRYNANGQLTHLTNTLSQVTTWAYDATGKLTSVTVSNATTSFTYDTNDRVRTITAPENYGLTFDYDALDRVTQITFPDGTYEQLVYNRLNVEKHRDRRGRWTQNFYNANRQLVAVQDALGRLTKFDWCGCGSLEGITDPLGRVTSFIRDLQGRVTSKVYPDGTSVNYTYETATSRLRSVTDAKNQSKWYTYFNDDKLKQISYTNAPGTTNVSFTYGGNYNRLSTMIDGIGGITNSYYTVTNGTLGAGQLKSIDGPFANDVITFTYDKVGRVVARDINGLAERYTFDALSRVTQITNVLGSFTNKYLNQTFLVTNISYPNGQNSYFAYYGTNDDLRLQSIWHKTNTATLSKFEYTYDDEGQIATWAQTIGTGSSNTWVMEYDLADQLKSVTIRTNGIAGAILKRYGYSYDKAGNRIGEQIDDVPNQGTVNNLNQLTSIGSAGPSRFTGWLNETGLVKVAGLSATMTTPTNFVGSANTTLGTNVVDVVAWDSANNYATNRYQVVITNGVATTLKYDANGNLTNQYTTSYTNYYDWDGEDRLVRITRRSVGDPIEYKSEFIYDGLGRRSQILERTNGVIASNARYLWCGTELCEKRGGGGGTATANYFDLGEFQSPTKYFYTRDHLSSVREMLNASQVLQARYDYDAYGRRMTLLATVAPGFGYTGHFYHSGTGLHLAMYRVLDSTLGRWFSRDPIEENGGLNIYAYAFQDPLSWLDPDGLEPVSHTHYKQGGVMVHSEVPVPGQSEGNVHIQVGKSKYPFNTQTADFGKLPKDIAKKLTNDKKFRQAIHKACERVNRQGGFAAKYGGGLGRFIPALAALLALAQASATAAEINDTARAYVHGLREGEDVSAEAAILRNQLNNLAPLSGEVVFPVILK